MSHNDSAITSGSTTATDKYLACAHEGRFYLFDEPVQAGEGVKIGLDTFHRNGRRVYLGGAKVMWRPESTPDCKLVANLVRVADQRSRRNTPTIIARRLPSELIHELFRLQFGDSALSSSPPMSTPAPAQGKRLKEATEAELLMQLFVKRLPDLKDPELAEQLPVLLERLLTDSMDDELAKRLLRQFLSKMGRRDVLLILAESER